MAPTKKSKIALNGSISIQKTTMVKNQTLNISKEAMNEIIAGFTDSLFTQLCLILCYYIFTQIHSTQYYFSSPSHMYYICYFIHLNILDSYIWGKTFRNSISYIHSKPHQNKLHTFIIILCQYISVFIGAWFSIKCIEYYYLNNQPITDLTHLIVGKYEYPNTLNYNQYIQYIWQSLLFQLTDRFVNGIIMTISPLIKQKTIIFDGKWTQVTFRCLLVHYLVTHNRMGFINNPNYGFYANLYYWRWSILDWIVLILPYIALFIWKITFSNLSFLHNPTYFNSLSHKQKVM